MNVLVACEESQRVCIEFRRKGHNAFSCDIMECSGGHPEWHIQGDVLPLLNGQCSFATMDGTEHRIDGRWDMIIAFPPCTYLTSAGTRHYSLRMNPEWKVRERERLRQDAANFFLAFANADCEHIAIENPVGYMNTNYRKPDQIIHPYFFASNERDSDNYVQKRTCLWLKNLPELQRTTNLDKPSPQYYCQGEKCKGKAIGWCEGIKGTAGGQAGRAKARSKTFPGIAKAMAEQWGQGENMRDKLIENIAKYFPDDPNRAAIIVEQIMADLTTNVVPQTPRIRYERLLKLAKEMHTWIFLNTGNEQEVYDKLGITEEENYVFGYGGKIKIPISEAPKEVG